EVQGALLAGVLLEGSNSFPSLLPGILFVFRQYTRDVCEHGRMDFDGQTSGLHHGIAIHHLLGTLASRRVDNQDAGNLLVIEKWTCQPVGSCFCLRTNVPK